MGGSVSHEKKGSMPDYVIKRDKEGRVDQNKQHEAFSKRQQLTGNFTTKVSKR